ncbi:tyrosine-type recombinase/integrase, partial [Virgisporangium aurantiacum]|uniref:tyrosine-type recombinase/integrase n=1 Tax=Virgisporangium aurantiacum TaxID=175570 RepID=UPI0019501413
VLDAYLEFLAVRSRPNTVAAAAYDLKVFFTVVGKPPRRVVPADVLAFVTAQYAGGPARRLQPAGDGGGVSARTVRRRLSSVSGLFAFLHARGDVAANPVPRGLPTRRERQRPRQGVPLVRTPRTLPRILEPGQVDALLAAVRTYRDRAMVEAMVLGGLRRCEVLGLRLTDLQVAARRVFIVEGKGGHQRQIPVSGRFFASVAAYLDRERPPDAASDRLLVVLKGPRRGQPLSPAGVDQILDSARVRAGLAQATCHQLRHTCLTRLREAGMALEAVQAQAGHASIESTRIYLHLADDWLASQYRRAAEAIDAQLLPGEPLSGEPLSTNPLPANALTAPGRVVSFVDGQQR